LIWGRIQEGVQVLSNPSPLTWERAARARRVPGEVALPFDLSSSAQDAPPGFALGRLVERPREDFLTPEKSPILSFYEFVRKLDCGFD
jgi:hypothetical protein